MDKQGKLQISKELEQFHCSILLDEVKEKVRKLKAYGVDEAEIVAAMNEEELFPQLVVTKDFRIVLPDYQNMEIKMEPIVKAVYLLFLKHPEGIMFSYLPDFREELMEIYKKIKGPFFNYESAQKSIEDVTDPLSNSINEKCSRIREAFVSHFDDHLARYYYIDGKRGEPKKILLPRDLVEWELD